MSGADPPVLVIGGEETPAILRLLPVLRRVGGELESRGRRLVLIGGLAVVARVASGDRATTDIDTTGRLVGIAEFPATNAGYTRLARWLGSYGELHAVGVEGTGAYGAGLARHLRSEHVTVLEVPRPDRRL